MYARAFATSPKDARVYYEWDQLKKRAGLASPEERLDSPEMHRELVAHRDDLTVECITLLNQRGQSEAALEQLAARRFSPWEGGEGLVSGQYVYAHRALGIEDLEKGRPSEALDHFEAARHYPENLGEGKHLLTLERDLDYFSGLAAEMLKDAKLAERYWKAAAAPLASLGVHSLIFKRWHLRCWGKQQASREILSDLEEFAARQMQIEPKIDYFATSLPNMLLFDDDLHRRNQVESLVLSALATDGLGDTAKSIGLLQQVLDADPNHLFAIQMIGWFKSRVAVTPDQREERAAQ